MPHTLQIGSSVNEAEVITTEIWDTAPSASIMLDMLSESQPFRHKDRLLQYEPHLHLFAAWCARRVQHLLADPRSHRAIQVAELFATGHATRSDLSSAQQQAQTVVTEIARAYEQSTSDLTDDSTPSPTQHPTGIDGRKLFAASLLHAASTASTACYSDTTFSSLYSATSCAKFSSKALYWQMLTNGADSVLIADFLEQEDQRQAQALRIFIGNPFNPESSPAMTLNFTNRNAGTLRHQHN